MTWNYVFEVKAEQIPQSSNSASYIVLPTTWDSKQNESSEFLSSADRVNFSKSLHVAQIKPASSVISNINYF